MVFFGLRTSSDQQITRMQEEIVKLAELREIKRQNRLSLLQRELDFSILASRVGNTLAQSIMSSQYVMGCIAVYFRREWIDYYLNTFAPIIELYQQIPDAATKAKFQLSRQTHYSHACYDYSLREKHNSFFPRGCHNHWQSIWLIRRTFLLSTPRIGAKHYPFL